MSGQGSNFAMVHRGSGIYCTEDARRLARERLPRLVFDFVDGATGRETGARRNVDRFDEICLQSRVLAEISSRSLKTSFLKKDHDLPFGIAPMGMCNLSHPGADRALAGLARRRNVPVCVSSAASTSLEEMHSLSAGHAWFQLYFGHSKEMSLAVVERAKNDGYDTLVLTVDVPVVSRRVRDLRNGFNVPFRLSTRSFLDFASHPIWSVRMALHGPPSPQNIGPKDQKMQFDRQASRAGADWDFLHQLRDMWPGHLIVKGITSTEDAIRVRKAGADAIYVSNHGGRQLDSSPAAIDLLAPIRAAVGASMPLIFDSGIRSGEDIVKALILGADLVMLGRPVLYALRAAGERGLNSLIDCIAHDMDVTMAQLGVQSVSELGLENLCDGCRSDHEG